MKIICAGLACFDQFFFTENGITPDFKEYAYEFLDSGGGPAGNAAYLLGSWGEEPAFAGRVGYDPYGKQIINEFKEVGVDTDLLLRLPDFTTVLSSIIVNNKNGSRTIVTRKSKDDLFIPNLDYFDEVNLIQSNVILTDGHENSIAKVIIRSNPNASVVLDAGKLKAELIELLPFTSHLVASEQFFKEYTGIKPSKKGYTDAQLIEGITKITPNLKIGGKVFITLGEKGCVTLTETNEIVHVPAFKVRAIDTTGAGDIFHGAFCFGLSRGWDDLSIMAFSSAASALSVQKVGVRAAIPKLAEVFELAKKSKYFTSC